MFSHASASCQAYYRDICAGIEGSGPTSQAVSRGEAVLALKSKCSCHFWSTHALVEMPARQQGACGEPESVKRTDATAAVMHIVSSLQEAQEVSGTAVKVTQPLYQRCMLQPRGDQRIQPAAGQEHCPQGSGKGAV